MSRSENPSASDLFSGCGDRGVIRFAVDADCCGALGCREAGSLLEVIADGKRRVLCSDCADSFLRGDN